MARSISPEPQDIMAYSNAIDPNFKLQPALDIRPADPGKIREELMPLLRRQIIRLFKTGCEGLKDQRDIIDNIYKLSRQVVDVYEAKNEIPENGVTKMTQELNAAMLAIFVRTETIQPGYKDKMERIIQGLPPEAEEELPLLQEQVETPTPVSDAPEDVIVSEAEEVTLSVAEEEEIIELVEEEILVTDEEALEEEPVEAVTAPDTDNAGLENEQQQKIILMMGLPAAGKGTQARLLEKEYGIVHLSTGDMLRAPAKQEDELGLQIQTILAEGSYAADDLMIQMISERIARPDCKVGFTLDGFPRTMPQVKALEKMLAENKQEISCVVALDVADEVIPGRCAERLICEICSESYHLTNRRPSFDLERCNSRKHDGQLVRRAEDMDPATVKRRIGKHHELTDPVLEYYDSLDIVKHVNGEQPIYAVLRDVSQAVGVTF